MNPNRLIRDIKRNNGIGTFISTQYTDQQLYQVIQDRTRMHYSRIYGHDIFIPSFKFEDKGRYNGAYLTFLLPKFLLEEVKYEKSSIIDIRRFGQSITDNSFSQNSQDMIYSPMLNIGSGVPYNGDFYMGYQPNYYAQGMSNMLAIAQTHQSYEQYRLPLKAKFKSPNMIEFNPRGMAPDNTTFEMTLKVGHAKNLFTVDEAHYYMFLQLAELDIKEVLWNSELKGLDGLSNGYDNIALKIDDWANTKQDREELIRKFEEDIVIMDGISSY